MYRLDVVGLPCIACRGQPSVHCCRPSQQGKEIGERIGNAVMVKGTRASCTGTCTPSHALVLDTLLERESWRQISLANCKAASSSKAYNCSQTKSHISLDEHVEIELSSSYIPLVLDLALSEAGPLPATVWRARRSAAC